VNRIELLRILISVRWKSGFFVHVQAHLLMERVCDAVGFVHLPHMYNIRLSAVQIYTVIVYRVSQEEWTKLRESIPYVKIYRCNPKHLYPKLNGYRDNGQRKVWSSLGFQSLYLTADTLSLSSHWVCFHIPLTRLTLAVLCICTSFRVTSALGRHA
jgi:hypothetical protein